MELPAQLRDITVDDPAAVLKQIHIRGVTHFGITAGGVNLHGAFVESAGLSMKVSESPESSRLSPESSLSFLAESSSLC